MSTFKTVALAFWAMLVLPSCATAQETFLFAETAVEAGNRADLKLEVPAGVDDPATFIPVTVLHGASPGPVAVIVAGVHGYEFAPILAAERLAAEIDVASLSGSIILVRVAHVSSFEARTPHVNPFDRKNLNRSFPGSENGTQTERVAWALASKVIPAGDFVFDLHSGDGAEWLEPFIGVYGGPLSTDYPTAFRVAKAMGFPNIVRYSMRNQAQIDNGRSLNRQAVAEGVATVLVEYGENGKRDLAHVDAIVDGVKNGLVELGMMQSAPELEPQGVRYFESSRSTPMQHAGIWHPVEIRGRDVEQGEVIGEVRDYHGKVLEVVRAPISGFGLYGNAGPPVRPGNNAMTIAIPATEADLTP